MNENKIIVVLGPTSSGKSDLAVEIAKRIGRAEIISADSRQVYKGFNLTAGTVPLDKNFSYKKIRHHLIGVASPKKTFSVAQYQKLGRRAIYKIPKENKVPIICGGTGLYIDSLIYDINFPSVKANLKLRRQLEKLPVSELYKKLKKLDPRRARNIDQFNKRRLIRAIEIITATGKPVPQLSQLSRLNLDSEFKILKIGILVDKKELQKRILKRIKNRIKKGMPKEVAGLHKNGLSWKRLESFGLELKWVSKYLQEQINKKKMTENLYKETCQYAKRQMTWWRKDNQIKWISDIKKAPQLVENFLKN